MHDAQQNVGRTFAHDGYTDYRIAVGDPQHPRIYTQQKARTRSTTICFPLLRVDIGVEQFSAEGDNTSVSESNQVPQATRAYQCIKSTLAHCSNSNTTNTQCLKPFTRDIVLRVRHHDCRRAVRIAPNRTWPHGLKSLMRLVINAQTGTCPAYCHKLKTPNIITVVNSRVPMAHDQTRRSRPVVLALCTMSPHDMEKTKRKNIFRHKSSQKYPARHPLLKC